MKLYLVLLIVIISWNLTSCPLSTRRFEPTQKPKTFCNIQSNGCCPGEVLICHGAYATRLPLVEDDPFRRCGCISSSRVLD